MDCRRWHIIQCGHTQFRLQKGITAYICLATTRIENCWFYPPLYLCIKFQYMWCITCYVIVHMISSHCIIISWSVILLLPGFLLMLWLSMTSWLTLTPQEHWDYIKRIKAWLVTTWSEWGISARCFLSTTLMHCSPHYLLVLTYVQHPHDPDGVSKGWSTWLIQVHPVSSPFLLLSTHLTICYSILFVTVTSPSHLVIPPPQQCALQLSCCTLLNITCDMKLQLFLGQSHDLAVSWYAYTSCIDSWALHLTFYTDVICPAVSESAPGQVNRYILFTIHWTACLTISTAPSLCIILGSAFGNFYSCLLSCMLLSHISPPQRHASCVPKMVNHWFCVPAVGVK